MVKGSLIFLAASMVLVLFPVMMTPRNAPSGKRGAPMIQAEESETDNIQLALSDASGSNGAVELPGAAEVEDLSLDETQALLDRLPPMKARGEQVDFSMRKSSLPAPRPGKVVAESFPPATDRDAPDPGESGPLKVLRIAPEGDVALAANVSISFSQPMVALTSHDDLAREALPVKLEPQPEGGKWRWLGTKILVFDGPQRLPMATRYQITVPAGTTSKTGGVLAETVTAVFSTPPPKVVSKYPESNAPQAADALLFLAFDQDIDPAAVVSHVQIKANGQVWKARAATAEELEGDRWIAQLTKNHSAKRSVAFRAVEPLPLAAKISVELPAGLPSQEGPLTTTEAYQFGFKTYSALKVTEHKCGWQNNCSPHTPWEITFNNNLDAEAFEDQWYQVEPAVAGLKGSVYGNRLVINGVKSGQTSYKVTLSANITDQFGQTLGKPVELIFKVGDAEPELFSPGREFQVLDPTGKPELAVYSTNYKELKLQLYIVGPEDWMDYQRFMQERWNRSPAKPPGELAVDTVLKLADKPNSMVETLVDLRPALHDGKGQVFVRISPLGKAPPNRRPPEIARWIQVTDLAIDAFFDDQILNIWTGSLENGKPVGNVSLKLYDVETGAKLVNNIRVNSKGLSTLDLPEDNENAKLLVAERDGDLCILPERTGFWRGSSSWKKRDRPDRLLWHIFNDRGMYKPGETVRFKGWNRLIKGASGALTAHEGDVVEWQVSDSRNNEFAKGKADVSENGGFNFSLEIPDNVNLGQAVVRVSTASNPKSIATALFKIQEFRRPEFEVNVSVPPGPYYAGDWAVAEVKASYYAGGGLAGADAAWEVRSETINYAPPGLDQFAFGHWLPWWRDLWEPHNVTVDRFKGATDGEGAHQLRIDFQDPNPATSRRLSASCSVRDLNNQQWSASASFLAHAARHFVGLRSERYFVNKGQPFIMEAVAADVDGNLIPDAVINIMVVRREFVFRKGQWREEETDPQEFELTSGKKPIQFRFKTEKGGSYRITAQIRDAEGRVNETVVDRWVSGGETKPARRVELEEVMLIPDRKEHQPGDTAEILVMAPFENAEGLVTLFGVGIEETRRFTIKGDSHTLKIPITDSHMPNVTVQVDLTGAAPRMNDLGEIDPGLPPRPAHATGRLDLSVPARKRALAIDLKPERDALEPGGSTWLDVEVTDSKGKPVKGAELVVFAVDEAILALSSYDLANPLDTFYPKRPGAPGDHRLRTYVYLADPETLREDGSASYNDVLMDADLEIAEAPAPVMMRASKAQMPGAPPAQPIAVRSNFNPLAAWFPSEATNGQGKLRLKIDLPDNLTRYRLMAVGVHGVDQFGKGEASLTARLPIMVRPSPPRFLNFGDQFSIPVLVQNQTDKPLEVRLAARVENAIMDGDAGFKTVVPAHDRVNVYFPGKTDRPGSAVFEFAAIADSFADAASMTIPVYTPATSEAFAVYGELDEGAMVQKVAMPRDVFSQFGGLEITTSSTALQALSDAVLYLSEYPFACTEQRASRILAIAALRDILDAFGAGVDPKAMTRAVEEDIKALEQIQNSDGGWGFWRRGERSWPYLSVHTANALARARTEGFMVSNQTLTRAKSYLAQIDRHLDKDWTVYSKYAVKAYALRAREAMGDKDPKAALNLFRGTPVNQAPMEGLGWLLPLLPDSEKAEVIRHFQNRVAETSAAATFTTRYQDQAWLMLHSSRRGDGIILESLIQTQPKSDLIPKVVRGLLAGRQKGRWMNTQENVFILLAMERYFKTYESVTPSFTARAWLGEQFAGEQAFKGRSTDYHQLDIPMSWLAEQNAESDLILDKEGEGRLYYRLGMRYAPKNLDLKPTSHGFFVERVYEAVDNPEDVTRLEDGTWVVKEGATVRVKITMAVPSARHHVALVDPLPAGLEAVNTELDVTPIQPTQPGPVKRYLPYWRPTWYVHQNLRDERAEAFSYRVWPGVFEYTYLARATTPGQFIAPPSKAEEMYHPETFGRSASDRVQVR